MSSVTNAGSEDDGTQENNSEIVSQLRLGMVG
jgi:hypothetical protein